MKIKDNIKTAVTCAIMPIIAGFLLYRHNHVKSAYIVSVVFWIVSVLSLICPKFGNGVHKAASSVGKVIGEFLSRIILFFVYVIAVVPTGLLMKVVKRDRLRLKKPDCQSYWIDNEQKTTDYEYQF